MDASPCRTAQAIAPLIAPLISKSTFPTLCHAGSSKNLSPRISSVWSGEVAKLTMFCARSALWMNVAHFTILQCAVACNIALCNPTAQQATQCCTSSQSRKQEHSQAKHEWRTKIINCFEHLYFKHKQGILCTRQCFHACTRSRPGETHASRLKLIKSRRRPAMISHAQHHERTCCCHAGVQCAPAIPPPYMMLSQPYPLRPPHLAYYPARPSKTA